MSIHALVIGGGIVGMLTARNLQRAGYQVTIVEKGALGSEASWAAGGILSPLYPWKQTKPAYTLMVEGQQQFPSLVADLYQLTNIDSELIRSGMLILDVDEKQHALNWAKLNNEPIEILSNELHEIIPNLSCNFGEAIYLSNVMQVRPPQLIKAIKKDLIQKDVTILEHTKVTNFLIESNEISGVQTTTQLLLSDVVVICSGAWTATLLQNQFQESIDIKPMRGQMLLYKPKYHRNTHIILRNGAYLIPRKDGHVLCGSTVEDVGFNKEVTAIAATQLHNFACEIFPELTKEQPIKQWAALRPGTSRDIPYICPHPDISGLYFNSGHFRYGILTSIASARKITELIGHSVATSHTSLHAC